MGSGARLRGPAESSRRLEQCHSVRVALRAKSSALAAIGGYPDAFEGCIELGWGQESELLHIKYRRFPNV